MALVYARSPLGPPLCNASNPLACQSGGCAALTTALSMLYYSVNPFRATTAASTAAACRAGPAPQGWIRPRGPEASAPPGSLCAGYSGATSYLPRGRSSAAGARLEPPCATLLAETHLQSSPEGLSGASRASAASIRLFRGPAFVCTSAGPRTRLANKRNLGVESGGKLGRPARFTGGASRLPALSGGKAQRATAGPHRRCARPATCLSQ